ncbi:MAG: EamA family transporter, partial [Rhodospirillaceae bacterium]
MALTLSMLFFASNHILGRLVPGEVPPIGLSLWRWVVATLVILPLTWREIAGSYKLVLARWKYFAVMTFFLVVLG